MKTPARPQSWSLTSRRPSSSNSATGARHAAPRSGVTLVELLAALAIIVLLMTLLVPAMLKLRSAASNAGSHTAPSSGAQPPSAFSVNRPKPGQPQDQSGQLADPSLTLASTDGKTPGATPPIATPAP